MKNWIIKNFGSWDLINLLALAAFIVFFAVLCRNVENRSPLPAEPAPAHVSAPSNDTAVDAAVAASSSW